MGEIEIEIPIRKRKRANKTFNQPVDKLIKAVLHPPKGWVGIREFAEKVGVSQVAISQAKQGGRLSPDNLRWVDNGKKKNLLFIDWDKEGPKYIMSRPREKWPKGFKIPKELREQHEKQNPTAPKKDTTGLVDIKSIFTLNDANIEVKKLQVQTKQLELQKSLGEVMKVSEVTDLLSQLGQTIRTQLMGVIPRIAPLIAAETDPHNTVLLLKTEFHNILEKLSQIDEAVLHSNKDMGTT